MAQATVSLNLGEKYFSVTDVEDKKDHLLLKSGASSEVPFSMYSVTSQDYVAKAAEILRKMVADAKVSKTETKIVIPDSQSYTRVFEMPLLTDKELISAIRYQADQFIPIPIDKVSLDIHIISKDKKTNKSTILLVAAPKTMIDHVVKIVEDAGLIPTNIENESSAILSLISRWVEIGKPGEGLAVCINFGNTATSIYLYDMTLNLPLQVHNFAIGQYIFYKDIQANVNATGEQIKEIIERIGFMQQPQSESSQQSPLDLASVLASPINEFTSEIHRFIVSSQEKAQADVSKVFLMGEGSKFAGLDAKIAVGIGLPVALLDLSGLFEKNAVSDYFAHDWPVLAASIGGNFSS